MVRGRLSTVTLANGDQVAYTRDANGNATVISETEVPPSGPSETYVTSSTLTVLNRMVEKREIDRLNNQNILTTTFAFDSRSHLVFRVDAEGTRSAGRMTSRAVSPSTSGRCRSGRRSTTS